MAYQVPAIEIRFLLKLGEYLRRRGVSIDDVMKDVGLDAALLEHPWTVIPLSVAGRILDHVAKLLGDNALGLRYARAAPTPFSGLLGQLLMAAPTVRGMVNALVDHHELHVRNVELRYDESGPFGRIEIEYPASFAGPYVHFSGYLLASITRAVRIAAGPRWMPRSVEFDHRPAEGLNAYKEILGPRIKFGRPVNALTLDRSCLGVAMPGADPDLMETLAEAAERLKAEAVTVHDIANQVHREISSRLATGEAFDLERIAETLALSPRALQYRLELNGTSYETILIETRRRLAERYLRDTDLAITEISARLGFSELSAFTRAAQRWFHMPPRTYRNHVRDRAIESRSVPALYGRTVKASAPPARAASARSSRAGSGSPTPRSSRS